MSIITTWEAVPSRLFSIFASLLDAASGEPKDRLEAWATPPSLRNRGSEDDGPASTSLFSNALREALALGLVEPDGDKLRVPENVRAYGKGHKEKEVQFRRFMLATLFDQKRAQTTQQSGFMMALAWFLTKSPARPFSFRNDPHSILADDLGDAKVKTDIKTVSDYQNFLYWARYLGFATFVGGRDTDAGRDARWVFPDPFEAIRSVLPTVFAGQVELPIDEFMTNLANIYPVFEGGGVRKEMEQPGTSSYASERRLSQATSFALQRLEDRKHFEMVSVADAPVAILDLGVNDRRISHLVARDLS